MALLFKHSLDYVKFFIYNKLSYAIIIIKCIISMRLINRTKEKIYSIRL